MFSNNLECDTSQKGPSFRDYLNQDFVWGVGGTSRVGIWVIRSSLDAERISFIHEMLNASGFRFIHSNRSKKSQINHHIS